MLRSSILTHVGLSLVSLLLLLPTASRAGDPLMLWTFDTLSKDWAKLYSHILIAPAWWQGEPEVLEAAATKTQDRAMAQEAEHEYLVARVNDLAGAKEAAYSAYRTIHRTNEDCAYWDAATTRMKQLEAELFGYSSSAWPQPVSECSHARGPSYEPLCTPEGKAIEEKYGSIYSVQHKIQQSAGSHHPLLTPAEAGALQATPSPTYEDSNDSLFDGGVMRARIIVF